MICLFRSGITHQHSITSTATAPQAKGFQSRLQTCSKSAFSIFARSQGFRSPKFSAVLMRVRPEVFAYIRVFYGIRSCRIQLISGVKCRLARLGEENNHSRSTENKNTRGASPVSLNWVARRGGETDDFSQLPHIHSQKSIRFFRRKTSFFVFYITFFCVRKYAIIVEKKEDTL